MGKLQFVAVNVEGSEEAVREAFQIAAKILDPNGVPTVEDRGSRIEDRVPAALPAPVREKKRRGRKPKVGAIHESPEGSEDGPPFKCYECGRDDLKSKKARALHMRSHKF